MKKRNIGHGKRICILSGILLLLSLVSITLILFNYYYRGEYRRLFLIWNLFLAWIPLVFSWLTHYLYFGRKRRLSISVLFFGILWLLFFPNAPYILTDFIHLGSNQYFTLRGDIFYMNPDFWVWYDFLTITFVALNGLLLGFLSLYLNQQVIKDLLNRGWSRIFAIVTLFVASFGIYLGRIPRWNSWSIFTNPAWLMESIIENLHKSSLAFTFLWGLLLSLLYLFLEFWAEFGNDDAEQSHE